jgi:signal peptidase II
LKKAFLIILSILLADQILKFWVKTHMLLGEQISIAGNWFYISFVENYGMAFGMEFGGDTGKVLLTTFRIIVVSVMLFYLIKLIRKQHIHNAILVSFSMIIAGAIGNIIDSVFYGLIFDRGMTFDPVSGDFFRYGGLAEISGQGYAPALQGCVVDMFYFPIIESKFPDWLPVWGGEDFIFFSPVFNIADASITCGVALFLIFRKKYLTSENNS